MIADSIQFRLVFYKRPNPLATLGQYFDEQALKAPDRLGAVDQAYALRAKYPKGTAFVALVEGDDLNPFWLEEIDRAEASQ